MWWEAVWKSRPIIRGGKCKLTHNASHLTHSNWCYFTFWLYSSYHRHHPCKYRSFSILSFNFTPTLTCKTFKAYNSFQQCPNDPETRLHQFARSLLYNATAVRGALWWLQKSHIVNYANHQHSAARLSPSGGTMFQTTFPLSFGKTFMKIRSAVPENGCLIVLVDGKKTKKKQKQQLQNIYASASYRKAVA